MGECIGSLACGRSGSRVANLDSLNVDPAGEEPLNGPSQGPACPWHNEAESDNVGEHTWCDQQHSTDEDHDSLDEGGRRSRSVDGVLLNLMNHTQPLSLCHPRAKDSGSDDQQKCFSAADPITDFEQ